MDYYPSPSGVGQLGATGFRYANYDLVYDVVLAGDASRFDFVPVDSDADYLWVGNVLNDQTGPFAIRYEDAERFRLSNVAINNVNMAGTASRIWSIWPPILLPAGSEIRFELFERSGAGNTIQIVFRGAKRYLL